MMQNICDDASLFEVYSRLERSLKGLDGAADLCGACVLDLGCGFG